MTKRRAQKIVNGWHTDLRTTVTPAPEPRSRVEAIERAARRRSLSSMIGARISLWWMGVRRAFRWSGIEVAIVAVPAILLGLMVWVAAMPGHSSDSTACLQVKASEKRLAATYYQLNKLFAANPTTKLADKIDAVETRQGALQSDEYDAC